MKNKFKFLTKMSLDRKIKTKWFLVANLILAIVIIGISNIDNIINYFGGDFDDITKIYVIDKSDSFDLFNNYINEGFKLTEDNNYQVIKYDSSVDDAKEMLKNDKNEKESVVLVIDNDNENVINVDMITNQFSNLTDLSIITNAINSTKTVLAISKYNITEEQLAGLTNSVEINREILSEEENSVDENMSIIMSSVFPIVILPFFMLTVFLVQMIGAEVNDEKTTRGMEIIISNVSPKVHFFSKCLAGNLFILIQAGLLILYLLLGLFSRGLFGGSINIADIIGGLNISFPANFLNSLIYIIPLTLLLMFITFVGYSLVAGILASMTTNTEDFQQIQTPIMMLNLIGYYLGMMAGAFKGAIFIKVLGYIPFVSAILAPSLFVLGDFTIIDLAISIIIMIVVIFLLIKYGLKIYKVGILNYSSGDLWKKMFKALKG